MSACTHAPEQYIGEGIGGHQWNCACGGTFSGPEPDRDDVESAALHHEKAAGIFRKMIERGAPEWVGLLAEQSLAKAAALRELLACKCCRGTGLITHLLGDQEWEESCDCAAGEKRDQERDARREDDAVADYEDERRWA